MIFYNNYGYAFLKHDGLFFPNTLFFQHKINSSDRSLLKLLWTNQIGCGACDYYLNSNPVVQDDGAYIFIADRHGVVKKLNIESGVCIWSKKLFDLYFNYWLVSRHGGLISTDIAVDKRHCYVGSESSKVYALDINTGNICWIARVSGEVISTPVVSQGFVIVYTNNGVLHALDARNGIIKWKVDLDIPSGLSFLVTLLPVVSSDIVVIGDTTGVVSACEITSGQLIWQRKISNVKKGITDIDRLSDIVAPIVMNGVVYAVAYNGNIVALDIVSGDLIWSRDIGSLVNIIMENGVIYLVDQYSCILAIDSSNGNVIWKKKFGVSCQLNSIVSYKDHILFGDQHGYVYWLFKKDGSLFRREKVGMSIFSTPIIVFDKLVVYEKNGKVSVFKFNKF
ncbi:PQQ-binding-like beta-propeller repeat protein [Blochmannia endosymbiont of Polyrhachis (Hedomyrma) turneri]|uniref:outer membrane protein assembly factor BamB family protein n=1 Tax=Blochmannia endosymbiont of Polyrhachis (Hedomyrma) turneri TaxID=1505596 RepID=UPI000A475135|nr:PQQ-binding-like beta-propeller repeat protein [Blochmannia endosymbiont of Polyrhachis (Hedomyrma) turneri]